MCLFSHPNSNAHCFRPVDAFTDIFALFLSALRCWLTRFYGHRCHSRCRHFCRHLFHYIFLFAKSQLAERKLLVCNVRAWCFSVLVFIGRILFCSHSWVVRVGDGIRINISSIRSRPKAHQWRWCTFIGSSFIMIAYFCRRNAVSIVFLLRNSVWSTHHSHPAASSSPSPLVATPHINSSKRLIDTIWLNHVWRWLLVIYWLPSAFCRTPYSSAHWKVCCIDNCTRNTLCMSNRRNWSLLFYILSPFRACLALPHTSKQYSIEFRVRIKIERSSWFARNFGKNKTFFYCSPVVLSDRALLTADVELNAVCAYSHLL